MLDARPRDDVVFGQRGAVLGQLDCDLLLLCVEEDHPGDARVTAAGELLPTPTGPCGRGR